MLGTPQIRIASDRGATLRFASHSVDLGLWFTEQDDLLYAPNYATPGQRDVLAVARDILKTTKYRPIVRETGMTLVDVGSVPADLENETNQQYFVDHPIFSHQPSRTPVIPNSVEVLRYPLDVPDTITRRNIKGSAYHQLSIDQIGIFKYHQIEDGLETQAEADRIATSIINVLKADAGTAKFQATMDVGLEVYDDVLVGRDVTGTAQDAGDPWNGLTSLGHVNEILRVWFPGYYRMDVGVGNLVSSYIPLTQSRRIYLQQQSALYLASQLFEVQEVALNPPEFPSQWSLNQTLSVNTIIPTGDLPQSGLLAFPWDQVWTRRLNLMDSGEDNTPRHRSRIYVDAVSTYIAEIPRVDEDNNPLRGDVVFVGYGAVRPAASLTHRPDLGSTAAWWRRLYVNEIVGVGDSPTLTNFNEVIGTATNQRTYNVYDLSTDPDTVRGTFQYDQDRVEIWSRVVSGNIVVFKPIEVIASEFSPSFGSPNVTLGRASRAWRGVYSDLFRLVTARTPAINNGAMWLDDRDIKVRTGDTTVNLSALTADGVVNNIILSVAGSVLSLSLSRSVGVNLSRSVSLAAFLNPVVVANPIAPATTVLTKLQVGSHIYRLESGVNHPHRFFRYLRYRCRRLSPHCLRR